MLLYICKNYVTLKKSGCRTNILRDYEKKRKEKKRREKVTITNDRSITKTISHFPIFCCVYFIAKKIQWTQCVCVCVRERNSDKVCMCMCMCMCVCVCVCVCMCMCECVSVCVCGAL